MLSRLYSTSENPAGSLSERVRFEQLEGARDRLRRCSELRSSQRF